MATKCATQQTRHLGVSGRHGYGLRLVSTVLVLAPVLAWQPLRALDDPVAAWDFDEGQGELLRDRVGTAHGTIRGAAWVACGQGYALRFDGVDDCVEFGNPAALSPTDAVTLEAWILPEKVPTAGEPGIVGKAYGNYVLTYYTDGKCWWYAGQSGTNAKAAVRPGRWHHVVGTYDGASLVLYVDGVMADRRPAKTGPIPVGAGFFLGKSEGDVQWTKNAHFCGLIDDVAVYGRAVSADEVRQQYLSTHLTGAPELTAFAHVAGREVIAEISLRALGPLPPGAVARVELRRVGRRRAIARTQITPLPDRGSIEANLEVEEGAAGNYVLAVRVEDGDGKAVGRPAETSVLWPRMPGWDVADRRIKVLNSLVSELRSVDRLRAASTLVDFTNPRTGWVFFRAAAKTGDQGSVVLALPAAPGADPQIEIAAGAADTVEAMRWLSAGKQGVTVECRGGAELTGLVIRAIPEIGYCRVDCGPQITPYGPCDWPFLEKHILPHINLAVSRGANSERERWEQWRRQGKRWIVETPLVGLGKQDGVSADEVEKGWTEKGQLAEPLLDGIIVDEFSAGNEPIWASWHEALRRIRDNPKYAGKVYYPYCVPLFGAPASRAFAQTVQDAGWAVALERYLPEEPSEAAARGALEAALVQPLRAWEAAQPGITRHTLVVWGFFISAPNESTNINPSVDFLTFMDMQMNTLANDPTFFGLYGVTSYLSAYADEETLRWYGQLVRHYCLEGGTKRLRQNYMLPHLQNPDFAEGLAGWTSLPAEEGAISTGSADGLSWLQGRYPPTRLGNTYLLLRRSNKGPNTVRQTVRDLVPGKLYSAKLISGDRQEYERGASIRAEHAVRLEVADADVLPEKSFRYAFNSCYSHTFETFDAKNPYFMTLHQTVFRARTPQAALAITDWVAADTPGGPTGQELMCNFVEVQPYLE